MSEKHCLGGGFAHTDRVHCLVQSLIEQTADRTDLQGEGTCGRFGGLPHFAIRWPAITFNALPELSLDPPTWGVVGRLAPWLLFLGSGGVR